MTTVVDAGGKTWWAPDLLTTLGGDGRRALSAAQRGALDALATQRDAWGTALLRVADAGWNAPSVDERRMLMGRAVTSPPSAAAFIRAIGSDGRRAPPTDVQHARRAAVQRDATKLHACLTALWVDLDGGRFLPSASSVAWRHVVPCILETA